MRSIPLTQGRFAVVDDNDYPLVATRRWHAVRRGRVWYAMTDDGRSPPAYMHRLILGAGPWQEVDHINADGLDNRRENLRLCTHADNIARARFPRGASGYRGVCLFKPYVGKPRPWKAEFNRNGKRYHLGYFASPEDAARAYDAAARAALGEWAVTNFQVEATGT